MKLRFFIVSAVVAAATVVAVLPGYFGNWP